MGWGEAKLLSVQEQLQDRNKALELKTAEVSGGKAKLLSVQEQLQDRNKALELKTAEVSGEGGTTTVQKYGLCQVYLLYLGIFVG